MYDDLLDDVDATILTQLQRMYSRLDPMPTGLVDRVTFALSVQALEAEVAELTRNSLAGVRGEDETDSITFTCGSLRLLVTTVPQHRKVRVDGWVTAPGAEIEIVAEGATLNAVADDGGRFAVADVPRGRTHFVVRRNDHRPVITPAVDL